MSYEELRSVYVVSYKTMLKANEHRSEISSGMKISEVETLVCFQDGFIWNYKYLKTWKSYVAFFIHCLLDTHS